MHVAILNSTAQRLLPEEQKLEAGDSEGDRAAGSND
jgi:hypothetical protein